MLESDKRLMNELEKPVAEQGTSTSNDGKGTSARDGRKGGAQDESEVSGMAIAV